MVDSVNDGGVGKKGSSDSRPINEVHPPQDQLTRVRKKSGNRPADNVTIRRLLAGDELAFGNLVEKYHSTMIRVARSHVPNLAIAEEVVQEAWLATLQGIGGFRGHSSLKTWIFGILINRAKSRGIKERRTVPFSSLAGDRCASDSDYPNSLRATVNAPNTMPTMWPIHDRSRSPEDLILNAEMRMCIENAIAKLTPTQRVVVILRDLEGWSSSEVCQLLEITPQNQRVRLHRARLRIRDSVRTHLARQSAK